MKKLIFLVLFFLYAGTAVVDAKSLPNKQMGLQLYSIREVMSSPEQYGQKHETIFKQLKEMGYTFVEAASYNDGKFYGVPAAQFKADLKAAGLKALSSHTTRSLTEAEIKSHDFSAALKWWKTAIEAHKAAGMKYIITPWAGTPKTLQEGRVICDYYNEIGKMCNAAGLKYGYHTHSHEFQKVEEQQWMDFMMKNVAAENMFWEMDVYWCVMAKESPVQWFKKYPGRFTVLHIKDKYEVGQSGMVGFSAIFNNAKLSGMKNFVIEMEATDGTIGIMEGVKRCAEYIRLSEFVKASY